LFECDWVYNSYSIESTGESFHEKNIFIEPLGSADAGDCTDLAGSCGRRDRADHV
jgi:hypothetical protein